jgi:serine phosphatase RsbU (regulator of sigma subunit)
VDYCVVERPIEGEIVSGDAYVVMPTTGGLLIAVVDGLGHGSQAAVAAQVAIAVIEREADSSVLQIMLRCHEELRETRGAALSLASLRAEGRTLEWLGVGNVQAGLLRADGIGREFLLLRAGVVGYRLPPLQTSMFEIGRGDILVFATDGIRSSFWHDAPLRGSSRRIADDVFSRHAMKTDDALVLVARHTGFSPKASSQ